MKEIIHRAILLFSLILVFRCEVVGVSPPRDEGKIILNVCDSDSDCGEGKICVKPEGFCALGGLNYGIYSVQLTPPPNSNFIKEQFTGVTFNESNRFDVTISTPLKIKGKVIKPDKNVGFIYPGFIVAVAEGKIPGTSLISESEVKDKGEKKGFELSLLPGIDYEITFIPKDEKIPNFRISKNFVVSNDNFDIILPDDEDYLYFTGIVVLEKENNFPLKGVRVYGISVDGKNLSTSSITSEEGIFKIKFPPQTGEFKIRIEPTEDSLDFPPVEHLIKKVSFKEPFTQQGNIFSVGKIPPIFEVTFQLLGAGNDKLEIVKGASVHLYSVFNNGLFNVSGQTDDNGIIKIKLFSGSYIISVIPQQDNPYARFETIVDFGLEKGSQNQTFQIILGKRPKIYGKILTDDGSTPVEDALIFATPSEEKKGGIQFIAESGYEGQYVMGVDPGKYSLVVIPPKNQGLARKVGIVVEIKDDDIKYDINLSIGTLIYGAVRDEKGNPLKDIEVEFFLEGLVGGKDNEKWGPHVVDYDSSFARFVQLVASSMTDNNGAFKFILPLPEINLFQNPLPKGGATPPAGL